MRGIWWSRRRGEPVIARLDRVPSTARLAVLIGAISFGCTTVQGSGDPHAVAPRYDRWEAVIAQPRSTVFDAALRVLTDSGYVMAQVNRDVAAISTADRRVTSATPGAQPPGTSLDRNYPVRLSLVMSRQGQDSTRLSISGQYRLENVNELVTVNARSGEWRFVRGIGEAILAHVNRSGDQKVTPSPRPM